MTKVECFFVGLLVGAFAPSILTFCWTDDIYDMQRSVGIEEIVRCEVRTATVHSNWCEIVWKDGYGNKERKGK